jgi:quinol monooxygenase YgiN
VEKATPTSKCVYLNVQNYFSFLIVTKLIHERLARMNFPRHQMFREDPTMAKLAIWAVVESKPGKEREVEEFLRSAQPLAEKERGTLTWYAVKIAPSKYAIFDTFANESGREAHLTGDIAKALMARAKDLFARDPEIHKIEVLAAKAHLGDGQKQGAHS